MEKVLITGGTGFIGSRLALRCRETGSDVVVYGQENTPAEKDNSRLLKSKGIPVILGAITDSVKLENTMDSVTYVFHLAAAQHEANVPDQVFWDINVFGTQGLLEIAGRKGVKRFIHGSTIGVYGSALNGVIDEDSPLRPENIYGVTKLEGEKIVLSAKERQPVAVVRISETYGPGDRRLLKLFKGIQKGIFFVIGSGENIHHLIYIDDLLDGMIAAAKDENAKGEVFVLAGKEPVTTNQMVQTIAEKLGKKIPPIKAPLLPFMVTALSMELVLRPLGLNPPLHRRRMDFFRKSFLFSIDRAQRKLGFNPACSFEEGVQKTLEWYRKKNYL